MRGIVRSQTQMSNSQSAGTRFSPSYSDDGGQEDQEPLESPSRTLAAKSSKRSKHAKDVEIGTASRQETGSSRMHKENDVDDGLVDSQETLSQESNGPSLFGAVARISSKNQKSVPKNTRRNLSSTRGTSKQGDSNVIASEIDQSEGSQGTESEFEDSIDVTATLNMSRRRSSGGGVAEDPVYSPQLMYGDTHLEASDDET